MTPHFYIPLLLGGLLTSTAFSQAPSSYKLPPIPDIPAKEAINSVPMQDPATFDEVQLDFPMASGPFKPNWKSIEKNYPGSPEWLRDAKFGIWVHFGPQAAGMSGDWYARRLYVPGTRANKNHLKNYGHPSEVGYKEVLRDWNPKKLDPEKLTEIYKDAGARFLMIQGVHHDQFDMWNSQHQPWNSTRMGPKRDLIGEWSKAVKKAGIRYGITFHHEYSWWWWQTSFDADKKGSKAGIPYDGNLTLADGKGKWWEGLDPRLLYNVDLREYETIDSAAHSNWSPPKAGIFLRHLDYARWHANWWAVRMTDAIDQYDPDFIYTDGTGQQPFEGWNTGTGYRSNAMQRDGNACICVSLLPDGSIDDGSRKMLKEVGDWMRISGDGVYGSKAWAKFGEGQKDGSLYAWCMTVPEKGAELRLTLLGSEAELLSAPIKSVELLGSNGKVRWKRDGEALELVCPDTQGLATAICFRIATP